MGSLTWWCLFWLKRDKGRRRRQASEGFALGSGAPKCSGWPAEDVIYPNWSASCSSRSSPCLLRDFAAAAAAIDATI